MRKEPPHSTAQEAFAMAGAHFRFTIIICSKRKKNIKRLSAAHMSSAFQKRRLGCICGNAVFGELEQISSKKHPLLDTVFSICYTFLVSGTILRWYRKNCPLAYYLKFVLKRCICRKTPNRKKNSCVNRNAACTEKRINGGKRQWTKFQ